MEHSPYLRAGTRSESMAAFPHPDTASTTEALETAPGDFDPQAWLRQFEEAGGGWIVRLCSSLAIAVEGRSDEEIRDAWGMVQGLTADQRAAVIAHLRDLEGRA